MKKVYNKLLSFMLLLTMCSLNLHGSMSLFDQDTAKGVAILELI